MESYSQWDPKQIGWGGFFKKLYAHHKPDGGALILARPHRPGLLPPWLEQKITAIAGTIKFFGMIGLTPAMAYFVGYMEVIGGILLILEGGGIRTLKPTCVALAVDMAVVVVWGLASDHGFFWGHELEFVLFVSLLAIYVMGRSRYSLAYL